MEKNNFKKQFWKMKQEDRVEYLLHVKHIEEHNQLQTLSFIGSIFYLFFYIIIIGLLFYIAFDNISILTIILPFLTLFKWMLLFIIVIDIFIIIRRNKKFKELNKRFKIKEGKPLWKRITIME